MKIFNGRKEAKKILLELESNIKKSGRPKMAVIAVEPDFASKLYVKIKEKAAERVGIDMIYFELEKESEVIRKIQELNKDSLVHGIIVQLPLPQNFNTDRIIRAINPRKDIDGFRPDSLFQPVLPSAILIAIEKSGRKIKRAVAMVNSRAFGDVLKSFLNEQGIGTSYFLKNSVDKIPEADALIVVCGCPGIIKGDMIKKGAVLIDAGITVQNGKAVGDIDRASVESKAAFLTPVPGGIGPLTVALLLKNVYLAYGNS